MSKLFAWVKNRDGGCVLKRRLERHGITVLVSFATGGSTTLQYGKKVATVELVFLIKGMILGFSIAAPVGPMGVLCLKESTNYPGVLSSALGY